MAALKKLTDRGFFFASKEEEKRNIYTRHNADGTSIKQVVLPDCRKIARIRQANGRDIGGAWQLTTNNRQQCIVQIASCTMISNRKATLSDIEKLSKKDFQHLAVAFGYLNKDDWQKITDHIALTTIKNIAAMKL